MHRPRARLKLLLLTVLGTVSLVALVRTRPDLGADPWSRGRDVALMTAWIIAVVTSAWLLIATGFCTIALALDRPGAARRIAPALPRGIRRLVEMAIAGSCVALTVLPAGPAYAATAPPAPTPVVVADQPVVRGPVVRAPAPAPPRAPAVHAGTVVVRPGDNLWVIARASLTRTSGGTPTEREVARYWLTVIAANRSTLRSRDPSLIFPGEIVTLPPPAPVS